MPGRRGPRAPAPGRGRRDRRRARDAARRQAPRRRRRSSASTRRSTSSTRRVNDETTVCHFCPNDCTRTFIDTRTPDGRTSRYISGFSCEKGTVESIEALKRSTPQRKELQGGVPEPRRLRSEARLPPLLHAGAAARAEARRSTTSTCTQDVARQRSSETPVRRAFQRSSRGGASSGEALRIGIPRVLNIYSTAPLWRTYFEALGIAEQNIVFSDAHVAKRCGRRAASTARSTPAIPSKVAQAHIHNLLFHKHAEATLDYIFFPCITHVPTFVEGTMDSTSLPDRGGRAEGDARRVHQGDRLLRARRHRVRGPGA